MLFVMFRFLLPSSKGDVLLVLDRLLCRLILHRKKLQELRDVRSFEGLFSELLELLILRRRFGNLVDLFVVLWRRLLWSLERWRFDTIDTSHYELARKKRCMN